MSKTKVPETGEGYLGEIMVHRISRALGVVENVIEAKAGWAPEITLKLPDGTFKKGRLSDFREPSHTERKKIPSPTAEIEHPDAKSARPTAKGGAKQQGC